MCTFWNSLVVQWLRLCISTVEDTCSIPVWGTIRFYMLLSVAKKQNKCVPLTLLISFPTRRYCLAHSFLLNTKSFESKQAFPFGRVLMCCSVTKSCPALCDPMDCSRPGFPVLHYLPESAPTHVH